VQCNLGSHCAISSTCPPVGCYLLYGCQICCLSVALSRSLPVVIALSIATSLLETGVAFPRLIVLGVELHDDNVAAGAIMKLFLKRRFGKVQGCSSRSPCKKAEASAPLQHLMCVCVGLWFPVCVSPSSSGS